MPDVGGSGSGSGRRGLNEINVTPFVDVVLVLLVIFMVTATLIVKGAIPLRLPEAGSAGNLPATILTVGVDADGIFLLKGERLQDGQMLQRVRDALEKKPELTAVISGDKRVSYGRVMELIDLLQGVGVKTITAEVIRKGNEAQK